MNNKRNKADIFLCCELIPLEALQFYPAGLFWQERKEKDRSQGSVFFRIIAYAKYLPLLSSSCAS